MFARSLVVAACCLVAAWAQSQQQYTTPVPILKQINRQNEDGSYSYGYEAADGSFKIETKHPSGEVYGKYGYVDDTGALREIEYGASKLGFQPAGTGINVAPPTIPDPSSNYVGPEGVDDGQYREDPSIYWKDAKYNQGAPRYSAQASVPRPAPKYNAPAPQYTAPAPQYTAPAPQYNAPAPQYTAPAPQYNAPAPQYTEPAPQYTQRSWDQYVPTARAAPVPVDQSIFRGHPATNFDVYTGSYSVNYK